MTNKPKPEPIYEPMCPLLREWAIDLIQAGSTLEDIVRPYEGQTNDIEYYAARRAEITELINEYAHPSENRAENEREA